MPLEGWYKDLVILVNYVQVISIDLYVFVNHKNINYMQVKDIVTYDRTDHDWDWCIFAMAQTQYNMDLHGVLEARGGTQVSVGGRRLNIG